ncbi:hypothetical protein TNCV_3560891 [Trichonephila clavipes]|nr:hypothetical protein TNCV_3560891 [Trichonephila clavipes]
MSPIRFPWYIILQALTKKYRKDCLRLESLREKKDVVSYDELLTINESKYSTFLEAAGLSKSEDFISEVLDDVASVINLTEV